MTYYASKELIDRVNAWLHAAIDDRLTESTFELLRDIAKAEPLPEEPRGPSEVYPQFCDSCSDSIYDDEGELIRNPRVEQLRKERDDAIISRDNAEKAVDEAKHQLLSHRREIDEALARAETAERERDEARAELITARAEDWNTVESGANPPSDVASVDSGDNPTLDAVCAVLGADVDSVEAQSAMLIEQARRVRPLEIAALDAMGWLRARLAESIGSSAVRESIAECADRIWSLVSDGAKDRWPCHPPGVESPVEPVDVVDECDEHTLPKDPPPSEGGK